jgi:hypothetical protein
VLKSIVAQFDAAELITQREVVSPGKLSFRRVSSEMNNAGLFTHP